MLNTIFTGTTSLTQILIMLASAIAVGVITSFVFCKTGGQSKNFAFATAIMPLISSVIIFMVNGNLGLSVAVAGSFTLVHFRSAKGSGREMAEVFICMMYGLILGMGYIGLAFLVLAIITIAVIFLSKISFGNGKENKTLIITVPEDLDYDGIFDDLFKKYTDICELESVRTKNMGTLFEIKYSVLLKDNINSKEFIDGLRTRNGNLPIALAQHAESETL